MAENPLEIIKDLDPEFFNLVSRNRDFSFKEGALPAKTKYLIALAIDAVHGATGGVKSLALQASQNGASKEEILEALHVANYVGGVGSVYTAAHGLKEVF
jgi:alkylhydroperoxidase/carboxymuconolactone decarboxylase family protein YurZ